MLNVAFLSFAALLAPVASANIIVEVGSAPIQVLVNGVLVPSVPSGQAFTIPLGAVGANEYRLVRIYDPTLDQFGLPDEDVGAVTITGSADATAQVDIAVIWRDSTSTVDPGFPQSAGSLIFDRGARNFGGGSGGGLSIPGDSLRARTRLAIGAVNEISGNITVGQVYRVQAGFFDESAPSGVISANITGTVPYTIWECCGPFGIDVSDAVEVVKCNDLISGRIEALVDTYNPLDTSQNSWGKIKQVVVGPALNARGIQGDILATTGSISTIFTTGPIGSASLRPNIHAANGITAVRAISDQSFAPLLARSFNMNLRANVDYVPTGFEDRDGNLQLVETAGSITGEIHAGNMVAPGGISLGPIPHRGIFAGLGAAGECNDGDLLAPVTIDYVMEGKIMGRRILAPVTIGWMLEGAVVAWDVDNPANVVPSISIGYGEDPGNLYAPRWSRGFVGTGCVSRDFRSCLSRTQLRDDPCDEESGTSTLAAYRIQTLMLRQMSVWETEPGGGTYAHARLPRVEVQVIDHLTMDAFREGVIWSGKTNPDNPSDPSVWYASTPDVRIGCMGSLSRLYTAGVGTVSVTKSLYGEVRAPSLDASAVIQVGGTLGFADPSNDATDQCECEPVSSRCRNLVYAGPAAGLDPSPRWHTRAPFGAIRIADATGLHGQIILNADASTAQPSTFLRGVVALGAFDSPTHVFSVFAPTSSDPRAATSSDHVLPHYSVLPSALGGGAIGVVPFAVHQKSSDALQEAVTGPNSVLLNTELNAVYYPQGCAQQDAVYDYYGGVIVPQGGGPPISLTLDSVYSVEGKATYVAQAALAGGATRHLVIRPAPSAYFPSGVYGAGFAPVSPLLCAGLPESTGAIAADPAGTFSVVLDCPTSTNSCDHTGAYDCTPDPVLTCTCVYFFCDSIDYNADALFPDTLDIDDFMSVFSGGPCSNDPNCGDIDFNNDGLFPDTLDIDALLSVFSGGPCLV